MNLLYIICKNSANIVLFCNIKIAKLIFNYISQSIIPDKLLG